MDEGKWRGGVAWRGDKNRQTDRHLFPDAMVEGTAVRRRYSTVTYDSLGVGVLV